MSQVSYAQMIDLIGTADVLVCASRDDPSPLVVLEAMALGRAIAVDAGRRGAGAHSDGESGLLVDERTLAAGCRAGPSPRRPRSRRAPWSAGATAIRGGSDARPLRRRGARGVEERHHRCPASRGASWAPGLEIAEQNEAERIRVNSRRGEQHRPLPTESPQPPDVGPWRSWPQSERTAADRQHREIQSD